MQPKPISRVTLWPWTPAEVVVVLAFCAGDAELMLENVKWQGELGGTMGFSAMLSTDATVAEKLTDEIGKWAWKAYQDVQKYIYPQPPTTDWPEAPNWAFQHTARHMQTFGKPWLWLESDAIPLCPQWLLVLAKLYRRVGKPFLGVQVPAMGHFNGVAIYPPDTPTRLPAGMAATNRAWDYESKKEMAGHAYDASSVIQHVWGVHKGHFHPQVGPPPVFKDQRALRKVNTRAVLFHRCKDASLINQLRIRRSQNQ